MTKLSTLNDAELCANMEKLYKNDQCYVRTARQPPVR